MSSLHQTSPAPFPDAGDEILSVNGHSTSGLSHSEAIAIFKGIRTGRVIVHVARRDGVAAATVAASSTSASR